MNQKTHCFLKKEKKIFNDDEILTLGEWAGRPANGYGIIIVSAGMRAIYFNLAIKIMGNQQLTVIVIVVIVVVVGYCEGVSSNIKPTTSNVVSVLVLEVVVVVVVVVVIVVLIVD